MAIRGSCPCPVDGVLASDVTHLTLLCFTPSHLGKMESRSRSHRLQWRANQHLAVLDTHRVEICPTGILTYPHLEYLLLARIQFESCELRLRYGLCANRLEPGESPHHEKSS